MTHIVPAFSNDMNRLDQLVLKMGAMTLKQVELALKAVIEHDQDIVAQVVSSDTLLNQQEQKIDTQAVYMLALRQPQARDLREIVTVPKIAIRLERIGDYAANMARYSALPIQNPPEWLMDKIGYMGQLALGIIDGGVRAYGERSVENALAVARSDGAIDTLYNTLRQDIISEMEQHPTAIKTCSYMLFIVKFLERIGDHAAGIAKNIHFMVTGKYLTSDGYQPSSASKQEQEPSRERSLRERAR